VAGRAGRGEVEGEVLVQTFTPFSPSIQFARHHDSDGFAEQELEFRAHFGFPPFSRMILITVRALSRELAEFTTQTLVRKLRSALPEGASIGEAAPAPLEKARGYHRFQTSLRGPTSRPISRMIQQTLAVLPMPEDVFVAVDVDPVNLL
jgi:primosomal protein N' (replication factor Y)